jgi:hypothetical protein
MKYQLAGLLSSAFAGDLGGELRRLPAPRSPVFARATVLARRGLIDE